MSTNANERRGAAAAFPMLALLALPVVGLATASSPSELAAGVRDPSFAPALWLSTWTTAASLLLLTAAGTPLAWWMARASDGRARVAATVVDLPVVLPPAVLGIALLETFGRQGLLGPALDAANLGLPFSSGAVVLAQVVVSAPFYVQGAAAAFKRVDPELLVVARTLGRGPKAAFFRVAVPLALPGLVASAGLAWARALGEFGATLLFAGNFPGATQTLPLAIYTALESSPQAATALALALAFAGAGLLLPLRVIPAFLGRRRRRVPGRWSAPPGGPT